MKNRKKFKYLLLFLLLSVIAVVTLFYFNNVPKNVTAEDKEYIGKILTEADYDFAALKNPRGFDQELQTIRSVQDAILTKAPEQKRIALNTTREPSDLYRLQYGQCGDRSRFMDKALRELGMETRFAFIFQKNDMASFYDAVFSDKKNKILSHAVVEVNTTKGWLVVDSVERWVSIDKDGKVYSLDDIQNLADVRKIEWDPDNKGNIYFILNDDFSYIYGLYSRHGKFYPPFTPIPDVNWQELLLNL